MKKIGDYVCRHKWMIIVITILLLIPSLIGMYQTKINYDILVYLPEDIDTLKGEHILTDDFHMGAFSITVVENMADKDLLLLENEVRKIEGVSKVVSIHDLTGTTIPIDILPEDIRKKVAKDDSKLMLITFENSTSDEVTLDAVEKIRSLTKDTCKVGGMSAMVLDTKLLFNSEMTLYVVIAVILCIIVLLFSLDSYLVPFLLILNIGIAILLNMGTNIFFGEICYITKAISSVLQLGVTTDFSIFLYHKYERAKREKKDKNKAMSQAIHDTLVSVFGSSLTTIAGFLALCTMNLTLGKDIGLVMAKGVLFGLICVITLFPALLLIFDKQIEKTTHKNWLPEFSGIKNFVVKHYKGVFILFLLLLIPAYICQSKTEVYYNLDQSIPDDYEYRQAAKILKEDYNIVSQEIILVNQKMKNSTMNQMVEELQQIDGVNLVLSPSILADYGISEDLLSDDVKKIYETDQYKMILINSQYEIATSELNDQIQKIQKVVNRYDSKAILAGEGPLMNDLVAITDEDFHHVNYTSIIVIFLLMIFVLKSISLPIILVIIIEFAIFINMGIPYLMGNSLPFIASVVIGTIQLGATIDYAILMTTKYLEERKNGRDKYQAARSCLDHSIRSIFVSGMCFFAATIGVGIVSKIDMIGSLCTLISRGAIISMLVVITVVPSFLLVFDSLICRTTKGFQKERGGNKMKKNRNKIAILVVTVIAFLSVSNVSALTKEETVFGKLDSTGKVKSITVNEHLSCIEQDLQTVEDVTNLKNILNMNGEEKYQLDGEKIVFDYQGNEIYYRGESEEKLPIGIKMTYYLDGKEQSLKKILGKSGTVKIQIDYENYSSHIATVNGKKKTLYTPFVVMMGTVIPTKDAKNVVVTNGKMISNGNRDVIVGLATPGLSDSLGMEELQKMNSITITYETSDFRLNPIYSVVRSKLIDSKDLGVFDKLDDMYRKVNTLSSSTSELLNGSDRLLSGLVTYNTKYQEYRNGIFQLESGVVTLNTTYQQLDEGIQTLKQSVFKIEELVQGLTTLGTGLTHLNDGVSQLNQLTSSILPLTIQLLESEEGRNLISSKVTQNESQIQQVQALLTSCSMTSTCTEENISEYQTTLNRLSTQKYALENLTTLLTQIQTGVVDITNGTQAAKHGMDQILENQESITTLIAGIDALGNGSSQFREGLGTLTTSMKEIHSATTSLGDASKTIQNGSETLANGLFTYQQEGISKVTSYVNQDVKDLLSTVREMIRLGNQYSTYTRKNESDEGSTKFILTIDGEKKTVGQKTTVQKKVEKKSFFQRIFSK